jgi:GxxExxY protein
MKMINAYEACLSHELGLRRVAHARQVAVPLIYKGITLEIAFRADIIVEQRVLVELKAIETVLPGPKGAASVLYARDRTCRGAFDQLPRSAVG